MVDCQTSQHLPDHLPHNLCEFPRGNPYLDRLAMLFEKVFNERRYRKFDEKTRQVRQPWLPHTRGPVRINRLASP